MASTSQNDNFRIEAPKPIDDRYMNGTVPYVSVAEANATIVITRRHKQLTVAIGNDEYWYKNGIADVDLILKATGGGGGSQDIEQVIDEGNDANGKSIVNLADPTNPQDVDTMGARNTAITSAVVALLDGVAVAGNTFAKLYSLIQAITGLSPAEPFSAAGGAFPTTYAGGVIKAGRSYRITIGGTIGSINQKNFAPEDLLIANVDNPTNNGNDWQGIESNRDLATPLTLGLVKLYQDLLSANTDGAVSQAAIVNAPRLLDGGVFTSAVNLTVSQRKFKHSISGAVAYTKTGSYNASHEGNIREDFLVANGVNKPTFSSDFVVLWDNWLTTINTVNHLKFMYMSNGKIGVELRYIG